MADRAKSTDTRVEYTAAGAPVMVPHATDAPLTRGLGAAVEVGGAPAAVVGSAGPTTTEHRAPNLGQALVPMPLTCTVRTGCDWFLIDGRPVARPSSAVQVPDAVRAVKTGVLQTENDFFLVGGEPVVRGT